MLVVDEQHALAGLRIDETHAAGKAGMSIGDHAAGVAGGELGI